MTPRRRLFSLRKTALKKIRRLTDKANHALTLSDQEREPLVSYIMIEALNTWNNFLRTLFLSCAIEAKSVKRKKITNITPIPTLTDAIGFAINANRVNPLTLPASGRWDRRDEPTWHDVNNFLRACQALNCSYIPDIQMALSMGLRVFSDLPVIRNYYAHRNESTALKVKNIGLSHGIPSLLLPTDILFYSPVGTPNRPLIVSMLDDLHATIDILCEGL